MTAVLLPTMPLPPSEEADEDVAFKVLNQDNLPIAVIGEQILKPFGTESQKLKPNVIVHPTRRIVTNLEENKEKPFAKSTSHINKNDKSLRKNFSKSHGHLNHTNSGVKLKIEDLKNQIDAKFTRTLDAKLKKLQRDDKFSRKPVQDILSRKPFVTTVKTGKFLEPPAEIATLFGIKSEEPQKKETKDKKEKLYYAFASQPRVLNRPVPHNVHLSRCEAAAKAAGKLVGTIVGIRHDENEDIQTKLGDDLLPYSNVMFDKRVFRGSNFGIQTSCQGDGESSAARAAEARRRAAARRKAKSQQIKSSHLKLGTPPPIQGRKHERIQTENYLEEIFVTPPVSEMCTQTDLFLERPVSPFYIPAKTGADAATQIYPGDLFDFDMEVQPILEVLVGKTIEQALIEVLEEEELAALREQQRRFLEIRAAETAETLRLEEREKRLLKEKRRRMSECEEGLKTQKEMEERIAAAVLMQGYMANLLPSVLEGLESEGYLMDHIKQDLDESFMPWLMKEVTHELQDMVSSRDVLTDIVKEILENRAEIYQALDQATPEDDVEEEGPSVQEMMLIDHMKLKAEINDEEEGEQEVEK